MGGIDTTVRLHPTLTRWWAGADLPGEVAAWTEVLIDLRPSMYRKPLSKAICVALGQHLETTDDFAVPSGVLSTSDQPGKGAARSAWKIGAGWCGDYDGAGEITCVRFTAPDGFRFAVLVCKSAGFEPKFATRKVQEVFPSMARVFDRTAVAHARQDRPDRKNQAEQEADDSATYDLASLADAVRNPDAWFAGWSSTPDERAWGGDLPALERLLGWSVLGFKDYFPPQVWAGVGLDPVTYLRWSRVCPNETSIVTWLSGLAPDRHTTAHRWMRAGWDPQEGSGWVRVLSLFGPLLPSPNLVAQWRDAGVSAIDAMAFLSILRLDPRYGLMSGRDARRLPQALLEDGLPWVLGVSDNDRRLAYLQAGFTHAEAASVDASDDSPSLETLHMLVALRQGPALAG